MRNILLSVVAAAGLVGCVGGIDMPAGGDPTGSGSNPGSGSDSGPAAAAARTAFDTGVYPIISATGRCVACHSAAGPAGNDTGFVGTTTTNGYDTAVGFVALVGDFTAGAPILAKIAVAGGHQGQSPYTTDEKTKITAWLDAELAKRASGGTGTGSGSGTTTESPGDATLRLTKEWSGCMTLANFTTANMVAFGNMRADNSACKTCHVNGEYGQIASDAPDLFFNLISTNRYYMAQYFSVDLSQGVASAKIIQNTKNLTSIGTATAPHTEHPRFTFAGSTGATALQKFYDLTVAAKTAGTCGTPTLTN
jgi:hypothetical protein